jgi:hypothetical protein
MSLVVMISAFMNKPVKGFARTAQIRVVNIKGSLLPNSRLQCLKAAEKLDASHLLFVDTDQTFPADLLHRLLAHHKDVVAANIATKSIPANTTARQFSSTDPQGIPVYSDEGMVGLERVWRVGTGVMLISRKAYKQLPHDCFHVRYMPERDVYQGEDWTMCEALEKAGVPIYVDHAISRRIGHLGTLDYGHDLVGLVKKEEKDAA